MCSLPCCCVFCPVLSFTQISSTFSAVTGTKGTYSTWGFSLDTSQLVSFARSFPSIILIAAATDPSACPFALWKTVIAILPWIFWFDVFVFVCMVGMVDFTTHCCRAGRFRASFCTFPQRCFFRCLFLTGVSSGVFQTDFAVSFCLTLLFLFCFLCCSFFVFFSVPFWLTLLFLMSVL